LTKPFDAGQLTAAVREISAAARRDREQTGERANGSAGDIPA